MRNDRKTGTSRLRGGSNPPPFPFGNLWYNDVNEACAYNLTERRQWCPPGDKFDQSIVSHGGLTVFDLKTKESKKLELRGFDSEFSPHGLGLVQDPVYFINKARAKYCIHCRYKSQEEWVGS